MDLFEELENKKRIEKTKENYKRSLSKANFIITIVFGSLGTIFLITGIILIFTVKLLEAYLAPIIVGGVFLIITIILNIIFRSINIDEIYDKYQSRINDGKMIYNTTEMSARIIMLESRVKSLEEELESIKKNNR